MKGELQEKTKKLVANVIQSQELDLKLDTIQKTIEPEFNIKKHNSKGRTRHLKLSKADLSIVSLF